MTDDQRFEPGVTIDGGSWVGSRFLYIVEHYGSDFFYGKTLLELGCGAGDLGHFFAHLGAETLHVDGRQDNLDVLHERYPYLDTYLFDLNDGLGTDRHFDIIIHMGLLYHLRNYEQSIADSCRQCDYLLLETEVTDTDDPAFVGERLEGITPHHALDGRGCCPSPAYVETLLTKHHMTFERVMSLEGGHSFPYNWTPENKGGQGYRAMWFCERNDA